jgi:hypothetical protein
LNKKNAALRAVQASVGNALRVLSTTSHGAAMTISSKSDGIKKAAYWGDILHPDRKFERCKDKGIILILQTNGQDFKILYQKGGHAWPPKQLLTFKFH